MQKILFVCLGNICRSPLGEGIMLHFIEEQNLENRFQVDSAGTAGYHINEAPDHRTIANAKKNGVDISKLRARKFIAEDFDAFDKIYVMDESNYSNVIAMAKNTSQKNKVDYLLNVLYPQQNKHVPDPYYGTEKDFEAVFQLVYKACQKIIETV
ncbi:MAG TPA: low molecular weight protein-tyrosine-phosphatase [Bacteroidia bacterium]|nr:low molecular weight protein-tyrosine-phosphatase [Bacteroidia bacterium]